MRAPGCPFCGWKASPSTSLALRLPPLLANPGLPLFCSYSPPGYPPGRWKGRPSTSWRSGGPPPPLVLQLPPSWLPTWRVEGQPQHLAGRLQVRQGHLRQQRVHAQEGQALGLGERTWERKDSRN